STSRSRPLDPKHGAAARAHLDAGGIFGCHCDALALKGGGIGVVAEYLGVPLAFAKEGKVHRQRQWIFAIQQADVPILSAAPRKSDGRSDLAARQDHSLVPG